MVEEMELTSLLFFSKVIITGGAASRPEVLEGKPAQLAAQSGTKTKTLKGQ